MINYQSCNSYIGGLKPLSFHIVQNVACLIQTSTRIISNQIVSHPDLENPVSGTNDACGHFVQNPAF